MFGTPFRRLMLCGALLASAIATAHAQGSPTIAPSDPIYVDVDRILALGLVDDAAIGQRPYSVRELARIASVARARLLDTTGSRRDSSAWTRDVRLSVRRIDAFVSRRLEEPRWDSLSSLDVHFADRISLGVLETDAPSRPIRDNGLGGIEADLSPLVARREGRRFTRGLNVELEIPSWVRLGRSLTVQVDPRIHLGTGADDVTEVQLLSANARLVAGNAVLTVGREHTVWSTSPLGGMFFSANAPGLDMVRIASDTPFRLPWLFRYAGPTAVTLQLADLGPSVSHSHAKLLSYKVSIQPVSGVELGASFSNMFGGTGARSASLADRLIDFLPFVDVFRHHNDATDVESDKLLGGDARVRLPGLHDLTLFGEFAIEDFDVHRLRSVLTDDAAYVVGVALPRLPVAGLSASAEWHSLGLRFYEHGVFGNGLTSRRFILGDQLGRDADGLYGSLSWRSSGAMSITANVAHEVRRNDLYEAFYANPDASGFVFVQRAVRPSETRNRVTLHFRSMTPEASTAVNFIVGAERTTNFDNQLRSAEIHGLAELHVTISP